MPPHKRPYLRRKTKLVGLSPGLPVPPNRAMRSIAHSARQYKQSIPASIQSEIADAEDEAKVTRNCTSDEEVMQEFEALLPDPGCTRGRFSQHLKTMDYYWKQKFVMAHTLVKQGEEYNEIRLQLDEISGHLQQIASHLGIKLDNNLEFFPLDSDMKPDTC